MNRLILHRSTVVVIKLERCRGLMPVTGRSIETTVITGRLGQNHTIAGDTKLLLGWWPVMDRRRCTTCTRGRKGLAFTTSLLMVYLHS